VAGMTLQSVAATTSVALNNVAALGKNLIFISVSFNRVTGAPDTQRCPAYLHGSLSVVFSCQAHRSRDQPGRGIVVVLLVFSSAYGGVFVIRGNWWGPHPSGTSQEESLQAKCAISSRAQIRAA
jgi:hypothetical protein